MSSSGSISTSFTGGIPVAMASSVDSSTMKRKNADGLNGRGQEPSVGEDSDQPEPKRSKVSPKAVASGLGIGLKQIKFPSYVQADCGTERAILMTISSEKAPELRVAAKILCNGGTVNRSTFSEALATELSMLAQLSHPNVGKLAGFEEDPQNGSIWGFLYWESNGNLCEFLATGPWNLPERVSLIKDLLAGLKYLHTREPPICHGNFKSRNVLVNSSSRAVVTDFVSARLLRQSSKVERRHVDGEIMVLKQLGSHTECTDLHQLSISYCGTRLSLVALGDYVRWEAPEVIFGMQPNLPCDLWATGWICCEVSAIVRPLDTPNLRTKSPQPLDYDEQTSIP
ncbi:hypothetical protein M407DRAFT_23785 [Tulasnella calospora MUT 4182]|uniref:Protein kinase domain-containing protein n=1 Tax=Tulasnella calospora MUT 4182 TaxID=1051891 RepID=A0A0C3Q9Z3_9AGAM|nr:hypothetical protein M407DRAFT_23785 [Tulasnella calospora MUT 4182]